MIFRFNEHAYLSSIPQIVNRYLSGKEELRFLNLLVKSISSYNIMRLYNGELNFKIDAFIKNLDTNIK